MSEANLEKAREIIQSYKGPKRRVMEVCGTHTHEIFRLGLRSLLPENLELISGPGCPVCVTPVSFIDEALMLAVEKNAVICTFGDLVRVPGSKESLADARGKGARVRIVYSPLDAEKYAEENPEEQVVFLSIGFETTTPSCAIAVDNARKAGIGNFAILTANKTMPAAYRAMKDSTDAFLYPGHVHAISGTGDCKDMLKSGVSGVIAGFTAAELLTAFAVLVRGFESGEPFFVNCYPRVVREEGSPEGQRIVDRFMEDCDAIWRGIGTLPGSGLRLREEFWDYDARKKFDLPEISGRENPACRCGEVLQGKCSPRQCPVFGKGCTPEHPVGACMVSSEGACSAWYLYR